MRLGNVSEGIRTNLTALQKTEVIAMNFCRAFYKDQLLLARQRTRMDELAGCEVLEFLRG